MYSNGAGNECRTGVDLLKTAIYTTAADVRQEFPGSSHMLNMPNGGWLLTTHTCTHSTPLLWSPNASITDLGSAPPHRTRHLLCPLSPIPPSQHQPSRRENISRLFVENILKIRQRYVTPKVILFSLAHLELSESWNVLISRIFQQPSPLGRYYHHQASKPNHPKDYYSSSRSQNIGEFLMVTACGVEEVPIGGLVMMSRCHVSRVMMVRPWPFPPPHRSHQPHTRSSQHTANCAICIHHIARRIQYGQNLDRERSIETFSFYFYQHWNL